MHHSPLQTSGDVYQSAKLKRAADALRWRAEIIKQMNSEAVNAICKLCKRIAANHQFIPEHFRPYFFGARLIPIAKKDGDIRPIAIGTIFHKLISSTIMYNFKEKLPRTFSPVQFGVGMPGGAENIVHGIRNLLSETIQTGHWSHWTSPMHSTLSAELPSSSKCRTSSPPSFHGCGSATDSTHICSSEELTQSPRLWSISDKMIPWVLSSSALQYSHSLNKPAHSGAVPHIHG